MDGYVSVAQMPDSVDLSACSFTNVGIMGMFSWPRFAILGRWIPASLPE